MDSEIRRAAVADGAMCLHVCRSSLLIIGRSLVVVLRGGCRSEPQRLSYVLCDDILFPLNGVPVSHHELCA